jgi:hypothetical protein
LTETERAGIESSLRKLNAAPSEAPAVAAAPAAVNDQITDAVTSSPDEALAAADEAPADAKPAGRNPFKKKP